ncbi:MAG: hypothetical protein ABIV47_20495, partial [Roseiflexaceae bacterium]
MQQLDQSTALGIAVGGTAPSARRLIDPLSDTAAASWGQLPALSLLSALGLLLVALANNGARVGAAWSDVLFWAGLLLLFVPAAVRLIGPEAERPERIGLVALVGMGLYLVKLLHSPLSFTFSDELQHWRTAGDIVESGYLFAENPLLPVSPLYPGLESITVALADLSGFSLFAAGVLVLGTARLVGMLALFLFYEQIGRSARLAGIAALLYVANPNYLFFDAQFAYESLALPLTLLTLFAAARRARAPDRDAAGLTLISLLGLAAVVITHHVTTYALLAFLTVWSLIASLRARDRRAELHPRGLALLALVASVTWLVYAATLTAKYLFPQLGGSLTQLIQLIAGEAVGRELFRSPAGQVSPLWERLIGYTAVVLILLGLPFGLRQLWRRQRENPLALTLAAGALAYPVSLAMRMTERGAEASNRGAAFLFVAIAFVLACWLVEQPFGLRLARGWLPVACAWATIIFLGGVAVGWPPPWARMPGPYLPAADSRSIEREGLAAAEWTRALLGPDNRLIADRTNRLLMGAYGEQRPVTGYADKVQVSHIFFAPQLGPAERQILRAGRVRYLVVDRRLSSGLPSAGVYFERGEVPGDRHTAPIDSAILAKFDTLAGVSRLFDSGDIVIYDVA